ncbi:hypothetical protein PENANT_c006G11165 [Penicillium antarcticum]|uniref:Lipoprotein n=1 Tax=Penicillium antarcticum TaxID=416450 RepID=A0A1V6QE44_9EURO|nr:hypothetical protein PENANT_c006G11165 [Penicillium antarcticum]
MFIQKLAPAFLAVVASLPAALAGTCAVVGEVRDIHGGGSQDVPATTGNGTKLTYDSQMKGLKGVMGDRFDQKYHSSTVTFDC